MGTTSRHSVGMAVRAFRIARGISQERLGSSQSFISDLERGVKIPSISKIDQLAEALGLHPLSILAAAYQLNSPGTDLQELLQRVERELKEVNL